MDMIPERNISRNRSTKDWWLITWCNDSISAKPRGLWWTTAVCLEHVYASHTFSTRQHKRSIQSPRFQGGHPKLVSPAVDQMWNMVTVSPSVSELSNGQKSVFLQSTKISHRTLPLTFPILNVITSFYPVRICVNFRHNEPRCGQKCA